MQKAVVIILNWNGKKLMEEYLSSVVRHTPAALARVVVADNASGDGSVEWLKGTFPEVDLICFNENYGFAGGYNRAVGQVGEEIVVLLNSDVEVGEGWIEPLLSVLTKEPEVWAVQPKIKSARDKNSFEYAGACGGYIDRWGFPFCRGRILGVTEKDIGQYERETEVFWCSGAALCIRREVYLKAGGLDENFFAHMEEIDLCWRLRSGGGRLKVCPQSVVYHLGGGSLPMNHPRKLFLNYRNNLLMLYKNLDAKEWGRLIRKRRLLDLAAGMLFLLKGEWKNVKSIWRAYQDFRKMKAGYKTGHTSLKGPCVFQGSIIFNYYFKHIRFFSDLWK